jgi:hypothetical protein
VGQIFSGAYTPLTYFFLALFLAAFVFEAWAFIDAIIRPAPAYLAAGKRTKQIWLLITGVAAVLGLASATGYLGSATWFLGVAAFVAAAVYMVDVRPKVREFRTSRSGKGNGTSWGPYGPW